MAQAGIIPGLRGRAKARLSGMRPQEVSVVTRAANRRRWLRLKSEDGMDNETPEVGGAGDAAAAGAEGAETPTTAAQGEAQPLVLSAEDKLQVNTVLAAALEKLATVAEMVGGATEAEGAAMPVELSAMFLEIGEALSTLGGAEVEIEVEMAAPAASPAPAAAEGESAPAADPTPAWDQAYIDALPDEAFLWVGPGGSMDEENKTTPRELRRFPVRDADGALVLPMLEAAVKEIQGSDLSDEAKAMALDGAQRFLAEAQAQAAEKAAWSTAYVNDLPDSAFLYIAPGGTKDEADKTVPRESRYFPVRDASGAVDPAHVRDALSRIPQADVPQEAKDAATAAAQDLLSEVSEAEKTMTPEVASKELGIEMSPTQKAAFNSMVSQMSGAGLMPADREVQKMLGQAMVCSLTGHEMREKVGRKMATHRLKMFQQACAILTALLSEFVDEVGGEEEGADVAAVQMAAPGAPAAAPPAPAAMAQKSDEPDPIAAMKELLEGFSTRFEAQMGAIQSSVTLANANAAAAKARVELIAKSAERPSNAQPVGEETTGKSRTNTKHVWPEDMSAHVTRQQ